jgi:N-acetylglucosaminyldiphosphoundecaprenol N-acetyl-beta-D-mannosaminyltransferase
MSAVFPPRGPAVIPAPGLPQATAGDGAATSMHFGRIPITERGPFPPPPAAACWIYLTLNAEIALSLDTSPPMQAVLQTPRARVSVDGQWLWWALRRKYPRQPLRKLAGSDLIGELAAHCARHGERLLLLGSTPQANGAAVQRLRHAWPGLAVAGHAPPPYRPGTPGEDSALAHCHAAIDAWQPHYVVLGLGASREQRAALALAPALDGRVHGLLCFGGAIDFASGLVRRAPRTWQVLGLEGLWRVIEQPARLGRLLRVLRILPVLARGGD